VRSDRLVESVEFDKGTVFVHGTRLGEVEYRIRGLSTNAEFMRFRIGAGLMRGRSVSRLFDRRPGGMVLVDNAGGKFKFTVFGLLRDGKTASVFIEALAD
jgi:hypothetical protein